MAVGLAFRCEDSKMTAQRGTWRENDVVDGNGRKGNDGVSGNLLVHDLEVQLRLTSKSHVKSLVVPDRSRAGTFMDSGLLVVLEVIPERELKVSVLFAKGLLVVNEKRGREGGENMG